MRWSLVALLLCPLLDLGQGVSYSNHWSTLVPAGLEAAQKVAADTGCELLYEIIPGEGGDTN